MSQFLGHLERSATNFQWSEPKKAKIGADRGFKSEVGAEIGQNRHRDSEAEGRPKGDGASYASGGRDEKKAVLRPPGGDRDGARSAMSVGREPRG